MEITETLNIPSYEENQSLSRKRYMRKDARQGIYFFPFQFWELDHRLRYMGLFFTSNSASQRPCALIITPCLMCAEMFLILLYCQLCGYVCCSMPHLTGRCSPISEEGFLTYICQTPIYVTKVTGVLDKLSNSLTLHEGAIHDNCTTPEHFMPVNIFKYFGSLFMFFFS